MLGFLPAPLIGIIAFLLYALNTIFWGTLLLVSALFYIIPIPPWRKLCHRIMHQFPVLWTDGNGWVQSFTSKIEWEVTGLENVRLNDWYLLVCNHQSWIDILVLERIFNHKIPTLKFFIKKELLWTLPVAGVGAWVLDFPFMERYSKSFLAKHPELKGKDIETTRKSCEKFKNMPTSIISFIEGTRFTKEKHDRQDSPYQYLLRPKAGGIAFAMGAMGEYFHKILNVTIVYPGVNISAWDYFCGRVKKIVVQVEVLPMTEELLGNYEIDRSYRTRFQAWINQLWQNKDQIIADIHKQHAK